MRELVLREVNCVSGGVAEDAASAGSTEPRDLNSGPNLTAVKASVEIVVAGPFPVVKNQSGPFPVV